MNSFQMPLVKGKPDPKSGIVQYSNPICIFFQSQSNALNQSILSEEMAEQKVAESLPGQVLSQFIHNVTDLDCHLVAAFETMLQQDVVESEEDVVLNVEQNFLILSGLILDPMCPLSNKLEGSLAPVVHSHTDRACKRLVHLFRQTLEMEQVGALLG